MFLRMQLIGKKEMEDVGLRSRKMGNQQKGNYRYDELS